MKVYIGNYPNDTRKKRNPDVEQKVSVRIDRWDTWSLDWTLANIILPCLKQIKEYRQGIPGEFINDTVDHQYPQYCFDFYKEGDDLAYTKAGEKYDEIIDKMIWSFEQILDNDAENQFHTGNHDLVFVDVDENGNEVDKNTHVGPVYSKIKSGPKDTHKYDHKAHQAWRDRVQEGLDLFGQYYQTLWT